MMGEAHRQKNRSNMSEVETKAAAENVERKECAECGRVLPLSEYRRNAHKPDEYVAVCNHCIRRKRADHILLGTSRHAGLQKVYTLPELAPYTVRQLLDELKARGVELVNGELVLRQRIKL